MRERLFITGRNSEPEQIGRIGSHLYILYTINCTALNAQHNIPYCHVLHFPKNAPNVLELCFWTFHLLVTSAAHKKLS